MSTFASFSPRLQEAIAARLGWTALRPVQEEAGAVLLAGSDALILAPTAGGKTEAAVFPLLSQLLEDPPTGVGALYIAPLKALLNNQADRLGQYTEMVGLRRFVWHGDTTTSERRLFLADPAELLMTTPESLEVLFISERVDAAKLFADLRMVVVDEIHALAGSDRGAHLSSTLARLSRLSGRPLQRVGLSATVGNPAALLRWLQAKTGRPGQVVDPPRGAARRQLLVVQRPELGQLALHAAQLARGKKTLFFCQSRATTELVAEHMRRAGTAVFVHHSAVSREERALAEERFHRGSDACIVCTSTLELGIDVGDLDRVLQSEAPDTVGSFLQRMGRTGRRPGQVANTTFFCEGSEGVLQAVALVELAKAGFVEPVEVNDRCWAVLVHQLLALSLAGKGVTVEEVWAHLCEVPDFAGIHRAEFERLVSWMLRDGGLLLLGGRLLLGPKAERRFGRRNFMELYAVFSSPQSYAVELATGQPLGTLNQAFVDRLVEGVSCFLLSGRAWAVVQVQHGERRVVVTPAMRGKQPTWGGFLPQLLGYEVCQQMLRVLLSEEPVPYLEEGAAAVLAARRAEVQGWLAPRLGGVEVTDEEIRWWTFAGGRINATLRYALEAIGGWKVIPDNLVIKVRGEGLSEARFREAVAQLREVEFWENERLWADVAELLPAFRLSKFQLLMPPWVERELVATHLLDVAGAWRWLTGAETTGLPQVPAGVRGARREEARPAAEEREAAVAPSPPAVSAAAPAGSRWVDTAEQLQQVVAELEQEAVLGLDVETTLAGRSLCLMQIATRSQCYLIDALEVADLSPLAEVLASARIRKVIHNASFERSVLGRHGLLIDGVVDTLEISRARYGRKLEGGHSLKAVCARELGLEMSKEEQTSDWARRPLSERQLRYAALDAEVLLRLYDRFMAPDPGPLFSGLSQS